MAKLVNSPKSAAFEIHTTVESSKITALEHLVGACDLSKQRLKFAMGQGAVWITRSRHTQRLRRAKRVVRAGDELHLYYNEKVLSEIPPPATLVADVGGYSVWHKPYGMRSQGSKWGDHCTITRWAERNLTPERSAFAVHRLDRAASGLILVAHSKEVAAALSELFRERKIDKRYEAIVVGDFSDHTDPLRIDAPLDGKNAVSEARFLRFASNATQSVLEVRIETGRKHQIRRHLMALGFPVVGDRLYGKGMHEELDLQLTARYLEFHCPLQDTAVTYSL